MVRMCVINTFYVIYVCQLQNKLLCAIFQMLVYIYVRECAVSIDIKVSGERLRHCIFALLRVGLLLGGVCNCFAKISMSVMVASISHWFLNTTPLVFS